MTICIPSEFVWLAALLTICVATPLALLCLAVDPWRPRGALAAMAIAGAGLWILWGQA